MRNYDFWKLQKEKIENKEKIILILAWIFYKTFETDTRFLSDKFWFKIKESLKKSFVRKKLRFFSKKDYFFIDVTFSDFP